MTIDLNKATGVFCNLSYGNTRSRIGKDGVAISPDTNPVGLCKIRICTDE
jgi:hypothetical protein